MVYLKRFEFSPGQLTREDAQLKVRDWIYGHVAPDNVISITELETWAAVYIITVWWQE